MPQPRHGDKTGGQEEAGDVVEGGDQHETTRRRGVPAPRLPDPRFGDDRRRDTEQLEERVHARLASVHDLERAHGHDRDRDDAGHPARPHPPCEECERRHAEDERRRSQEEGIGARPSERKAEEVVERRMRVTRTQEVEEAARPIDGPPSR